MLQVRNSSSIPIGWRLGRMAENQPRKGRRSRRGLAVRQLRSSLGTVAHRLVAGPSNIRCSFSKGCHADRLPEHPDGTLDMP